MEVGICMEKTERSIAELTENITKAKVKLFLTVTVTTPLC